MELYIVEYGVMHPSYFSGTSGVMLTIHATNRTTCKQIVDMLESEINFIYDHIEYTCESFGYDIDQAWVAIKKEIVGMREFVRTEKKEDKIYSHDLTCDDLECENVAIFTIEFE